MLHVYGSVGYGAVGFSRCMIPASRNSLGGTVLGDIYR
jgi:hypothetical protein